MGQRIVDTTGYPIGNLYPMFSAMLRESDDDLSEEKDRRDLFLRMGIPRERFMSVVPVLMSWVDPAHARKIKRDIDMSDPKILTQAMTGGGKEDEETSLFMKIRANKHLTQRAEDYIKSILKFDPVMAEAVINVVLKSKFIDDKTILVALRDIIPPYKPSAQRGTKRLHDITHEIEKIKQKKNIMYLDIGSSEGHITQSMAEALGLSKDTAFACDIRKLDDGPNYTFRQNKIDKLPFDDSSFNVVSLFMSAHHFTKLDAMLNEIVRVCKKDEPVYLLVREHNKTDKYDTIFYDFIHAIYSLHEGIDDFLKDYNRIDEECAEVCDSAYAFYRSVDEWIDVFNRYGFTLSMKPHPPEKPDKFDSVYILLQLDVVAHVGGKKEGCASDFFVDPEFTEEEKKAIRIFAKEKFNKVHMDYDPKEKPLLEYRSDKKRLFRPSLHLGQRKLFIGELRLLTDHVDPKKDKIVCVYAGAAPGAHTPYLSNLFPNVEFHLYDPAPFVIKETERIKLYNEYYTDDVAKKWSGKCDIFISDIRLGVEGSIKWSEKFEEQVSKDMKWQYDWVYIMKPRICSMLKFRPPYEHVKDFKYLDGYVMVQDWAPQTSTESRLVVTDIKDTTYDTEHYDNWFYSLNVLDREWGYFDIPFDISLIDGMDHCYDCMHEALSWIQYIKKYNEGKSNDELVSKQISGLTKLIGQRFIRDGSGHGHMPESRMCEKREHLYEKFKIYAERSGRTGK